ncbi:MAG: lipoyl synthase [Halobacteriovoraceae bacterium]|nr:lipoyl synthase [Halobacteriovoraceae bacterium]MCB9095496.1 lipoyl synthase [Halobacteriovoraceae bacterium]
MKTYEISKQKPTWVKSNIPKGDGYREVKENLRAKGLYTVCEEAKCPNLSECWKDKTATIMILGDTCTRACKFCHVKTGNPKGFINPMEVENSSLMVGIMNLNYVVITSVDRDDISDYGANHFANVVKKIKIEHPNTKVEVLVPDFNAEESPMHTLARSEPFVIAQNMETVKRLTHVVRDPRAGYEKTLRCLQFYKDNYPTITTKTSLMVGLGETFEEIYETLIDLRNVGVDIVTFGQYLQPSQKHLSVEKFYTPIEFDELKRLAYRLRFKFVASGPMVRSSYKAADYLKYLEQNERPQISNEL